MVPQLVTQLDLAAPLVLVVGRPGSVRTALVAGISALGLACEAIEYTQRETLEERAPNAYKIIWFVETSSPIPDEITILLQPYARKTVIVFPLVTGIAEGLFLTRYSLWREQTKQQQQLILSLNEQFTDSLFVFVENLAYSNYHPLYYLLSSIEDKKVYDPDVPLSIVSIPAFTARAVDYFFRPGINTSILLKGPTVASALIVNEFIRYLKTYYNQLFSSQKETVTLEQVIPFSVTEVLIDRQNFREVIDALARELSPSALQALASSHKKETNTPQPARPIKKPEVPPVLIEQLPVVAVPVETPTVPIRVPRDVKKVETPPSLQQPLDVGVELQRIFQTPRTVDKVARVEKMAQTEVVQTKKSKRKRVLFYGGLGFIGIGFSVLFLAGVFMGTQFWLKKQLFAVARSAVETQTVDESQWRAITRTATFLEVQASGYGAFIDVPQIGEADHLVTVTTQLAAMNTVLNQAREDMKLLFLALLGRNSGDMAVLAQKMTSEAQTAYETLSQVQAGLEQISFTGNSEEKQAIATAYEEKIATIRKNLITQRKVVPLFTDLFGTEKKKTYVVLLQNNQELRPTGGFIQAAALLNFANGTLLSHNVYSSYEIDALFAGQIEPPEDLRRFLGEQKLYFRDSNWNPDFTVAAPQAAQFIEKSFSTQVDGVIALNLDTFAALIEAIGPLDVPEYNEVITHKNLAERMEFHSEVILVADSKKRDYSSLLLEKFIAKVQNIQEDKVGLFAETFVRQLDAADMLLFSADQASQEIFHTLGWTGSLVRPECPSQFVTEHCTVDVIAQVATNVGVNKANYYVEESVQHSVVLTDQAANHTRKILVENTAQSSAWPKGDYRAYYRLYVSPTARLDQVVVNNQPIPKTDIVERIEQGRLLIGFLVNVPIKGQTEVTLTYTTPLSGGEQFAYALFTQEQPGTQIPTTVTIIPHEGLRPSLIAPQATITGTGIEFDTSKKKAHGFYGVEFR